MHPARRARKVWRAAVDGQEILAGRETARTVCVRAETGGDLGHAGSGRDPRWRRVLCCLHIEAGKPLDLIRWREREPDDQVDLADSAVPVEGLEPVGQRGSVGDVRCAVTGVNGEPYRLQTLVFGSRPERRIHGCARGLAHASGSLLHGSWLA